MIKENKNQMVDTTYRVLYADTDAMGIVYNANYLRMFEAGRGAYLNSKGLPYKEIENRGYTTPITEVYAHYYLPFKYDDLVIIQTSIFGLKKASFRFNYSLSLKDNPDKVYVTGYSVHALLNKDNKISPLPDWILNILK